MEVKPPPIFQKHIHIFFGYIIFCKFFVLPKLRMQTSNMNYKYYNMILIQYPSENGRKRKYKFQISLNIFFKKMVSRKNRQS